MSNGEVRYGGPSPYSAEAQAIRRRKKAEEDAAKLQEERDRKKALRVFAVIIIVFLLLVFGVGFLGGLAAKHF